MDTPELAAFVAVADHGSFSAAADALHLTQSAVSRRIATLERRLAVPVFDRIGRRVALTEAGRTLLPRARRILGDLEDTRTLLRDLSGRVAGPLALATSHHIGLRRLPPVLRAFSGAHPDVELDLQFLDSEAAHELLLQGALELAVVTLAPGGVPPLASEAVWDDPLVFAVGADDALRGAATVTLAELATRSAVLPGPGSIGLGWTVLPATMIEDGLFTLAVDGAPSLRRTLGWVRHPGRTPSNAALAFVQALRAHCDIT
jgi:DNA-binding transcriptional LysR family regulator